MRILLFVFSFALIGFFAVPDASAQEDKSTSKATDKLYEKGFLKNAELINTQDSENLPSFYQNGIVYVSSPRRIGSPNQAANTELFYAELGPNGDPLPRQPIPIKVSQQIHKGQVTFNREGTLMLFTQSLPVPGGKGALRFKVFEARRGNFDWEQVTELPFNSNDYSIVHPFLSPDEKRLYFASDMPGGQGGFDLYMAERQGNSWGKPINLGPGINTAGNEMYPFAHESGNLFFSSNGHEGLGGLDIYKVEIRGREFGPVQNFGFANSPADEFGFVLNPSGTLGFLASNNKEGKGAYDIYRFKVEPEKEFSWATKVMPTSFEVYDKHSGQALEAANIWVYECTPEGHILQPDAFTTLVSKEADGLRIAPRRKNFGQLGAPHYRFDQENKQVARLLGEKTYLVLVAADGYQPQELLFSTRGKAAGPQNLRIAMDYPEEMMRLEYDASDALAKDAVIILENIEYDFSKSSVRKGATPELDALVALLQAYPNMHIELIAHTDSRGSEKYNLDLSRDRANSAMQYLVSRGIASSRVKASGMGKAQLRNGCSDGVACTEQQHRVNRRIEVRVTKF
jgi:outer membrane protein OmpA-like peptidoglycan-associated protein